MDASIHSNYDLLVVIQFEAMYENFKMKSWDIMKILFVNH